MAGCSEFFACTFDTCFLYRGVSLLFSHAPHLPFSSLALDGGKALNGECTVALLNPGSYACEDDAPNCNVFVNNPGTCPDQIAGQNCDTDKCPDFHIEANNGQKEVHGMLVNDFGLGNKSTNIYVTSNFPFTIGLTCELSLMHSIQFLQ